MSRQARAAFTVLVIALFLVPGTVFAAFPGQNGKIAFVRGGPEAGDAGADVYILDGLGGSAVPLDTRSGQHRHPSWSPDLTKIAYALFDGSSNEKVWVQTIGVATLPPRLGPNASDVRDDRPSWSHDGKRIAYESEAVNDSGQMDILITDVSTSITGPTVNLTNTAVAIEGKPVWSPDDKWIYYSSRPTFASPDDDILRERSDNSSIVPSFVINSATAEYQPALSPDGTKMCYTRGPFGSAEADVYVVDLAGSGPGFDLSDSTVGAYNCTWSPDGKYVAYVNGVFTQGALVYEPADDSGTAQLVTTDTANHFDGNPDWAPIHPAFCQGTPATIAGTDQRDVIHGTDHRDVIIGFGGDDTILSGGGKDLVCGAKGADTEKGGDGDDTLFGGPGRDTLNGQTGRDACIGGPGGDTLISCER